MFDKKYVQQSNQIFSKELNLQDPTKNIYFGEVISIVDLDDGGRIQVRIPDLDNEISDSSLSYCYPILPKFFWNYPKVGEMVRIFIEDSRYSQKGRHWMGSIISQPQKIKKDDYYSALSTTGSAKEPPEKAISTIPDAFGVFPLLDDIGLIGRDNTDMILRERELEIRCGKHVVDNNLSLNRKNPATIKMNIEEKGDRSSIILSANKIALLSHEGSPKFKAVGIDATERDRIFKEGHPMAKGDILVAALEIIRIALINHIHGYSNLSADKSISIQQLEKIDFKQILSEYFVIN